MSLSYSISYQPKMQDHNSSLLSSSVSQCSTLSLSDDQISITSSEYFQRGGSEGFGLRKQNLSHDRTCLWIMVIFLPLCSSLRRSSSLCASAISYEVAIVLCQRNERAGTSLGAGFSHTLSLYNVLIILQRHMKAEKVAHAGEDDCCGTAHN